MEQPRVVVTLADPERAADASVARVKNGRYLEALERAGAIAVPLDETSDASARTTAFATMDGLLLSGGADVDPALYGQPVSGSRGLEPGRDALEAQAFAAAGQSGAPVLGVCRGLQMINVLSGGSLVQHLDGHESQPYPSPAVTRHGLDLVPGTRFAVIVGEAADLEVNSYHHQAVTVADLGASLRASAMAPHPGAGDLVEALESTDPGRWLIGVQCHPERTESSPPVLERLWAAFVAACATHAERRRSRTAVRAP